MIRKELKPGRDESKKSTTSVEIRPQNIEDFAVPPSVLHLLTLCKMKVVIDFTPAGVTSNVVDLKTGRQLGLLSQFLKATQIDRIANDYKKTCISDTWRKELCAFLFRVKAAHEDEFVGYTNEVLTALKPWLTILKTINSNFEKLNILNKASEYFLLINEFYIRCRNVIEDVMRLLAIGKNPKIKDLLYQANVPHWIYKKLVMTNLTFDSTKDYRFFFPSNPTKAILLTLKEIRNDDLMEDCSLLLGNSKFLVKLAKDNALLSLILGKNPEGDEALKLLLDESAITLIPPTNEYERFIKACVNPSFKGIDMPSGFWDNTPQNLLPALSAILIQTFYLSFRRENIYEEFLKLTVPQIVQRTSLQDKDYKLQISELYQASKKNVLCMNIVEGEEKHLPILAKWICDYFGTIENSFDELLKALKRSKKRAPPDNEGSIPTVELEAKTSSTTTLTGPLKKENTEVKTYFQKCSTEDLKQLKVIFKSMPSKLKVRKREPKSLLTEDAKVFLKDVKESHSKDLSEELESFFLSLPNEDIQRAIVRIAEIKFDDIVTDFEPVPLQAKTKKKKHSSHGFNVIINEEEDSDDDSLSEKDDPDGTETKESEDENEFNLGEFYE